MKDAPVHLRVQAIAFVAKFGDRNAIPTLEALVGDRSIVGSCKVNGVELHSQVGDVALGVMIKLSGQELEDFHFPWSRLIDGKVGPPILAKRSYFLFHRQFGFDDDAARQLAHRTWREWRSATKK